MTYLEKAKADQPWRSDLEIIKDDCPEDEDNSNCNHDCERCWTREMPDTPKAKDDMVNSPNHYNAGGYECWDVMEAVFGAEAVYHFSLCNAFKYLFRAGKKDDLVQDLRKAIVYLEKAIEVKEKQKNDGERN